MKLKEKRESLGMNQAELAEKSGIRLHAIQHYEQGFRDLNGAKAITVYKLAKALGCTVEDLLEI